MGMQLFDDVDDNEDISKIEPNLNFAKRYEHNKKREDLHRLEELKKKGLVDDSEDESDSDDDSDDEDAAFMSKKHDLKFYDALLKIKNRDPIINQKDKNLFEESDDEGVGRDKGVKKTKAKFLKDVNAISAIDGGGIESDEDEGEVKIRGKSYWDEQEEIRKAVLVAAQEGDDSDGDLLVEKKRNGGEGEEDDEEEDEVSVVVKKLRNEYHGEDEELDENERFLKEYLGKQMWKAKDDDERKGFDEKLSEDEEEVEKAEEFEAVYNHRFEEGAGDRILGHSRFTEGSVRKKSSARKLQRKNKEERIAKVEFERKEELKRLKNLKKKEIEEKLEKIRAIAGITGDGACAIDEDDLEEEFDPEEYDRKMKETFDEDYYDEEDVDPGFGSDGDDLEKPDFDKEDELLGLPKDWDVGGSADGFVTTREKILKRKAEVDSEDVEEELPGESKRKKKRKIPLREKLALDEVLDEYYKLDYEDTIGGDIKTRFKYASVPSQRYGLNKEELLMMEEKELNQYVPLKKLAPYREKEWKVPNSKRYALKMKKPSLGKEVDVKHNRRVEKSKHKGEDRAPTETSSLKEEKAQLAGPNGEVTLSRRAKRRRRQAGVKLSTARLAAYGINRK